MEKGKKQLVDGQAFCCKTPTSFTWRFFGIELCIRLAIGLAALLVNVLVDPFERYTPAEKWVNFSYPHRDNESWPIWLTFVILFVVGVATLTVWMLVLAYYHKASCSRLWNEFVYFAFSLSLAIVVSFLAMDVLKVSVGRLRPDFLERCFSADRARWPDPLPNLPDCGAADLDVVKEGRKSFPSGHAANSWCITVWLALYNYSRLCMIRDIGSLRLAIPFTILFFPLSVSVSRLTDYWHHPTDVVAGAFLGTVIAVFAFRFYYKLHWGAIDKDSDKMVWPAAEYYDVCGDSMKSAGKSAATTVGHDSQHEDDVLV